LARDDGGDDDDDDDDEDRRGTSEALVSLFVVVEVDKARELGGWPGWIRDKECAPPTRHRWIVVVVV
jgi:hypothetical protein